MPMMSAPQKMTKSAAPPTRTDPTKSAKPANVASGMKLNVAKMETNVYRTRRMSKSSVRKFRGQDAGARWSEGSW